jgi:hypothetical protein
VYQISSLDQKPALREQIDRLSAASWPRFLLHGNVTRWERLFDEFAAFQILFCEEGDHLVAVGHTTPLVWNGTVPDLPATIDGIFERALEDFHRRAVCNTLCAQAAMIDPAQRGRGLSTEVLRAMRKLAAQHGMGALIGPVRPTLKERYPLAPMERYVQWQRADGAPFDPWIRVHARLGAQGLAVAPNALAVTGTVAEWEQWTGMNFPDSGDYVVEGALQPVRIDRVANIGHYADPNYWMRHPVP